MFLIEHSFQELQKKKYENNEERSAQIFLIKALIHAGDFDAVRALKAFL